jgi:hypothetical protein
MSAGVGSRCIPSKRDRRRGWESSSDSSVPPRLESSREEEEEEEEEEEGGGVDGTVPGEMEDATSDDGRNCEGEKPMHVERGAMRRMSLIVVVSSTRERKQGMAGRAAIVSRNQSELRSTVHAMHAMRIEVVSSRLDGRKTADVTKN